LDIAIHEKVAPRIAAAVGSLKEKSPHYIYGDNHILFDLASLTKIIATTSLCARAVERGLLSLSENPLPMWPSASVQEILQHTSGLPSWDNFYERGRDKRQVLDLVFSCVPSAGQKGKSLYSDIGFIALGDLLERRFKQTLDEIFRNFSFENFSTHSLSYNSRREFDFSISAPTGFCPIRKRRLVGEVNDLNAFALNEVAAHAGLFGTIEDVSRAARYFLECYKKPKTELQKTLFRFMNAKGERAIGFDRATKAGSTGGALSSATVGHLGFTGTSLWIDPEANNNDGAYFVLLTNYVDHSSRKQDIKLLRQDFHRAAIRLFR
jgi:CubicO group peptidase (beta-lactamase class C family)